MTTAAEINAALPCQFIDTTAGPYCTLHGGRWIKDVGQCDQRPGLAVASAESGDEGLRGVYVTVEELANLMTPVSSTLPWTEDNQQAVKEAARAINDKWRTRAAAQPEPEPGLRGLDALDALRQHTAGLGADLETIDALADRPGVASAAARARAHLKALDDIATHALAAPPQPVDPKDDDELAHEREQERTFARAQYLAASGDQGEER